MTEVRVPLDMWAEEGQTGSVVVWLFPDGAAVKEGEVIAEILVDKATMELQAPTSGILLINVEPEVVVDRGQLLANIVSLATARDDERFNRPIGN